MVKLNVQEEVGEEREITDAPRMLRRKVGGNYGKGFSFNKKRRTRQVAMTRYVGGRQIGKRIPGPLSKSSIKSSASSECVVQGKEKDKASLSLEPQVDMELVAAGVGVQQTEADQMGVLEMGEVAEVEHRGQSDDHICSDRDIQLAEGKALRQKVQNLGLNDVSNIATLPRMRQRRGRKRRRKISTTQEVPTRGFRVVNVYGDIRKKVVPDPNNGDKTSEDTSDAKYHKLHSSREKAEKKIVKKQRQSDKWERRNKREKGNRKTNRRHEVKVRRNMRLGPEPCDATHISVEENLPSSVLGREMPPIISKPFELPGCKDSKDQFEEEA